jgi:hypothetical protein
MEPNRKVVTVVCLFASLLCLYQTASASTTSAYAAISKSGHGAANKLDNDSALGSCQTYVCADCPDDGDLGCVAWASTTSTVTVTFGDGPMQIVGTSVTPSNQDCSLYPGHAFTNTGSANFWDINAKLLGQGLQAQAQLLLSSLAFSVPFGPGSRTIGMNLLLNDAPVYGGSYTLTGSGDGSGSGIYIDSFFDVVVETDSYRAVYNGPASLAFDLPVHETFSLQLECTIDGDSTAGSDPHALGITIPQGYEFVPEPATLSLMALSGLALVRRRRVP